MTTSTILVIRKRDRFSELLIESGFSVINLELVATKSVDDLGELEDKLSELDRYDGIFFTSPAAAEIFAGQFTASGAEFRGKAYVLGGLSKAILDKLGINIFYKSEANTAEELIKSLGTDEFTGKRLLFVRGEKSLRTIPDLLSSTAEVDELIVYRTVEKHVDTDIVASVSRQFERSDIHWICFFSPSGVDGFNKLFDRSLIEKVKVAAIGKTTAEKAIEAGFKSPIVSPRANANDFAEFLIDKIGKNE